MAKKLASVPTFKDGTPNIGLVGIARLLTRSDYADHPYDAGYDAGMNGSNTVNSHFSIFSTKENAKEWDRGKADGERAKAAKRK